MFTPRRPAPTPPLFRLQGLRVHDNPALLEAVANSAELCPIFILDPWFLSPNKCVCGCGHSMHASDVRIPSLHQYQTLTHRPPGPACLQDRGEPDSVPAAEPDRSRLQVVAVHRLCARHLMLHFNSSRSRQQSEPWLLLAWLPAASRLVTHQPHTPCPYLPACSLHARGSQLLVLQGRPEEVLPRIFKVRRGAAVCKSAHTKVQQVEPLRWTLGDGSATPLSTAPAAVIRAAQEWGVTQLCFESDTEPYAKKRCVAGCARVTVPRWAAAA